MSRWFFPLVLNLEISNVGLKGPFLTKSWGNQEKTGVKQNEGLKNFFLTDWLSVFILFPSLYTPIKSPAQKNAQLQCLSFSPSLCCLGKKLNNVLSFNRLFPFFCHHLVRKNEACSSIFLKQNVIGCYNKQPSINSEIFALLGCYRRPQPIQNDLLSVISSHFRKMRTCLQQMRK